ncbi:MAG: glutamine-hydrolyzing carbamoyl-phosphate synthase small subunit [Akkermansiaceae bacterium]|jgi:carbamoyl-phosphate synthase small subunit|nr:glutamine-hydrolyzing carbamoyl-phosphate synthase small subunit [Akkermansiaceae bacterium]
MKAILALEDGRHFVGEAFGATGEQSGEICFNTSMTGYQEILTDPSYRGQIVTMTYPLIGNYGVNDIDTESNCPHVKGFVIEELCEEPSNWRSENSLQSYLKDNNIIGIQGIDTRSLTKHLRERGAMKAMLTTEDISPEEACSRAAQSDGVVGMDFVQEVTTEESYQWDPDDTLSREWVLANPTTEPDQKNGNNYYQNLPEIKYQIVAYDFGIKQNILRCLRREGFSINVVNARTSAEDVLSMNPDGVFLSNGPGDPEALGHIHTEIKSLLGKIPVFGICLGHQVLAHAIGGKTYKLKFGHRGGNQPVKDLRTDAVAITSQNHGFAVDADSLPSSAEVTHINLNDDTVEGLRSNDHPTFSVQYHPEASPGPNDAKYFFSEFAKLIEDSK